MGKQSAYEAITERIVEMLEEGVAPWRKPWRSRLELPRKVNGDPYQGINVMLLLYEQWRRGYGSNLWLTRQKVERKGGRIKPDQKPTEVFFWKVLSYEDPENLDKSGKPKRKAIPFLRDYLVYNLDQVEGVRLPKRVLELAQPQGKAPEPVMAAEAIVAGMPDPPAFAPEGGSRAAYSWSKDTVYMPRREDFVSAAAYYATKFHELGHSTGAAKRLDRAAGREQAFGSEQYGREELVAEMTSAFLSGEAGLDVSGKQLEQSAGYLQAWIRTLRADPKAVVVAAGQAQKAADFILGRRAAGEEQEEAA